MNHVRRILLIGLGTIARTHLTVLGRRPDVEVLGGVDPAADPTADGGGLPVWRSLPEALTAGAQPDLVVVATPTDTHPAIVEEVLTSTAARVLCEKPLARDLAAIETLSARVPGLGERVTVAHHFAFSPEVTWAKRRVQANPRWGAPVRILSVFNDAYAGKAPEQLASYVSPWVDSGPNQLSLLGAFADGWRVVGADHERLRSAVALEHGGGSCLLTSNWLAADTSKQTTLDFRDGSVQVRMDHTSMTGLVVEDGRVTEHSGYSGTLSRKDAHYAGLYDVLLSDPGDPRLGVPLAADIARLLAAGEHAPGDRVAWSDVVPPASAPSM